MKWIIWINAFYYVHRYKLNRYNKLKIYEFAQKESTLFGFKSECYNLFEFIEMLSGKRLK